MRILSYLILILILIDPLLQGAKWHSVLATSGSSQLPFGGYQQDDFIYPAGSRTTRLLGAQTPLMPFCL